MGSDAWPRIALMLVTDRRLAGNDLPASVAAAVAGGVNLVQLRERDLPAGELLALARRLREITAGRAMLVINDRADVAVMCGADGVHLAADGLPVESVRKWLPRGMRVGRSVHDAAAARRAASEGADYLVAGTIFPSKSHPGRPAGGITRLQEVAGSVRVPVIAIGGIGPAEAALCRRAGAAGVAVIRAILEAPEPGSAAAAILAAMEGADDPHHGERHPG